MENGEVTRRDFLKLAGLGLGTLALSPFKLPSERPLYGKNVLPVTELPSQGIFDLTTQVFRNGILQKAEEVARISSEYPLLFDVLQGVEKNSVIDIYNGPNGEFQAYQIQRPNYDAYHEIVDYGLEIGIQGVKKAYKVDHAKTYESTKLNYETYTEIIYDPKLNKIFSIKKTAESLIKTEKQLLNLTKPNDKGKTILQDSLYGSEIGPFTDTNSKVQDVASTGRYFEIKELTYSAKKDEWRETAVILPGSLWHNRLKNIVNTLFIGAKDSAGMEDIVNKLIHEEGVVALESEANMVNRIFDTLAFDQIKKEGFRKYNKFFLHLIPKKDRINALSSLDTLATKYPDKMKKLDTYQLVQLYELLLYRKNFIADFNYTPDLFKAVAPAMMMPFDIADKGGLFVFSDRAGLVVHYDPWKVGNEIQDPEVKNNVAKINNIFFDASNGVFKDVFETEKGTPLLFGLSESCINAEGKEFDRYSVVKYRRGSSIPEIVAELTEDNLFYSGLRMPPSGNLADVFQTDRELITNNEALKQIGILELGKNEKGVQSMINTAYRIEPKTYWRRTTDFNQRFKPQSGLPFQRYDDPLTRSLNTRVFFFDDNGFEDLLSNIGDNSRLLQPKNNEWITDITHITEQARREGEKMFSDVAFGGMPDLIKKITEGPIRYIDETGQLACFNLVDSPPEWRDTFFNELYPKGFSLAVATSDIPVFSAQLEGASLFLGQEMDFTVSNGQIGTPQEYGQKILAGEYVAVQAIVFNGDFPFAVIKKIKDTSINPVVLIVPLQSLIPDRVNTTPQDAMALATTVALAYLAVSNPVGRATSEYVVKELMKIFFKAIKAFYPAFPL